ncbi:MAG TPA: TetR/AcrR family transcriptional regulator [Nocardioides sp.]|uniref:TetR/AcrR family transcriptional regulator n=1 Tax=Nocardioides sp. TaxID=35761 RepID=UPI002E36C279|nr:TetR/AcrR family transcriptional regulator [Nocardioides sp.]HEX3932639.1 TetR/AcrR family transcriptional regulator [Nocardioides sp.]
MERGSEQQSVRRVELVDAAYAYALQHGLAGASLRPVAEAIGSSTGVLRFLFGSKDGLVRAVLARARAGELELLAALPADGGLEEVAVRTWQWLADPAHAPVLRLWVESYATALIEPDGPWGGFARQTVDDWLRLLARAQPAPVRRTAAGAARRTAVLAVLRGGLLDLVATGQRARVTRAVLLAVDEVTTGERQG